jgi:hypothetical protein
MACVLDPGPLRSPLEIEIDNETLDPGPHGCGPLECGPFGLLGSLATGCSLHAARFARRKSLVARRTNFGMEFAG